MYLQNVNALQTKQISNTNKTCAKNISTTDRCFGFFSFVTKATNRELCQAA